MSQYFTFGFTQDSCFFGTTSLIPVHSLSCLSSLRVEHMLLSEKSSTHEVKNEISTDREMWVDKDEATGERKGDRKNCPLIGIHLYSMRQSFSIRVSPLLPTVFSLPLESHTVQTNTQESALLSSCPGFPLHVSICFWFWHQSALKIEIECLIVNQAWNSLAYQTTSPLSPSIPVLISMCVVAGSDMNPIIG